MLRKNLIAERKLKDLTQEEIAARTGITSRQYQRLEAGTSRGSVDVWERLKGIFNKPIDYLLEQVDESSQ